MQCFFKLPFHFDLYSQSAVSQANFPSYFRLSCDDGEGDGFVEVEG